MVVYEVNFRLPKFATVEKAFLKRWFLKITYFIQYNIFN